MPHSFQIRSGDEILNVVIPSAPEVQVDWITNFDPQTDITLEDVATSSFAVVSAFNSAWAFSGVSAISSAFGIDLSSAGLLGVDTSATETWFFATASAVGSSNTLSFINTSAFLVIGNSINTDWFLATASAISATETINTDVSALLEVSGVNVAWIEWSYT